MSGSSKSKYIIGTIVLLLVSFGFIKSSFDVLQSKNRLDEINGEVAALDKEKQEIEKEIEYKKTDDYVEEKARNELNLIKPGEKVYVVVENESSGGDVLSDISKKGNEEDVEATEKKQRNWYSWYKLFFDN
ncbi:MAG TPA: septum formation initiator family protein [bacterium]|nr:septum formation initiator family protein [bacterium]